MVVPPGLHTASFMAPGCVPVARCSCAVPAIICAARRYAVARGRPFFTPPSASDSRNMAAKAGPHPATALAGESRWPATGSMSAMPPNSPVNVSHSSVASECFCSQAITPQPTAIGVLGMAERWWLPAPSRSS